MTLIVMRNCSCVLLPNGCPELGLDVDVEVGDEEVIRTALQEAVQGLAQGLLRGMCVCGYVWVITYFFMSVNWIFDVYSVAKSDTNFLMSLFIFLSIWII